MQECIAVIKVRWTEHGGRVARACDGRDLLRAISQREVALCSPPCQRRCGPRPCRLSPPLLALHTSRFHLRLRAVCAASLLPYLQGAQACTRGGPPRGATRAQCPSPLRNRLARQRIEVGDGLRAGLREPLTPLMPRGRSAREVEPAFTCGDLHGRLARSSACAHCCRCFMLSCARLGSGSSSRSCATRLGRRRRGRRVPNGLYTRERAARRGERRGRRVGEAVGFQERVLGAAVVLLLGEVVGGEAWRSICTFYCRGGLHLEDDGRCRVPAALLRRRGLKGGAWVDLRAE